MGELVLTTVADGVALLRLNRPEARNALSPELMERLIGELEAADRDPAVRCIVIAGSNEVFAAGADVRSLAERPFHEALLHPAADFWRRVASCRTPLVAAVSGWALGRRLRAGALVRPDRRLGDGDVRPARDNPRDHPGRWRHPASGARDRQAAGDGAGADRPSLRRGGGRATGHRQPRHKEPGSGWTRRWRSPAGSRSRRRWRRGWESRPSSPPTRPRSRPAWNTNAACTSWRWPARTASRERRRSSRSGKPSFEGS